jgi:UDP-N-acetylglucosamine/UDP-N-acetylgalactosamine diphosphorylase
MPTDPALLHSLQVRGVIIHAPASVLLRDLDPERIEAGVEIYPAVTLEGRHTLLGAGTCLGRAGGGTFRNVRTGRQVDLYGGFFDDCVFLDGVTIRGHAEVRGGTLLEEHCEAAHHAGYKQTIMLPFVIAGSLVNFCDALVAGGTDRRNHSEIGSTLALYNYTPWGDKYASLFGNVADGVFLDQARIFVGGQTQIVSPVEVGFGTVIPAGASVRRSVGDGRLYGERTGDVDEEFDAARFGAALPKVRATISYLENLRALQAWYRHVRLPWAVSQGPHTTALYEAAAMMLEQGVRERVLRADQMIARLPSSRLAWLGHATSSDLSLAQRAERRVRDHDDAMELWGRARPAAAGLQPDVSPVWASEALEQVLHTLRTRTGPWVDRVRQGFDAPLREAAAKALRELGRLV